MWAKCYLKTNYGGGISTTSRIESFHAKLKRHLTSSSRLEKLFQVFREIEKTQVEKFKEEFLRHGEVNKAEKVDFLKKIEEKCSKYILHKISPKLFKALNYNYEKKRTADIW